MSSIKTGSDFEALRQRGIETAYAGMTKVIESSTKELGLFCKTGFVVFDREHLEFTHTPGQKHLWLMHPLTTGIAMLDVNAKTHGQLIKDCCNNISTLYHELRYFIVSDEGVKEVNFILDLNADDAGFSTGPDNYKVQRTSEKDGLVYKRTGNEYAPIYRYSFVPSANSNKVVEVQTVPHIETEQKDERILLYLFGTQQIQLWNDETDMPIKDQNIVGVWLDGRCLVDRLNLGQMHQWDQEKVVNIQEYAASKQRG